MPGLMGAFIRLSVLVVVCLIQIIFLIWVISAYSNMDSMPVVRYLWIRSVAFFNGLALLSIGLLGLDWVLPVHLLQRLGENETSATYITIAFIFCLSAIVIYA